MKMQDWIAAMVSLFCLVFPASARSWKELASPEASGCWVRPAQGKPARALWGHVEGLRVGLSPLPGPRGLLRLYAPYLGHREGRMINFIAVEPIPEGQTHRGFSELERSDLDQVRGKRFWSADCPREASPQPVIYPARGVVESEGDVETLTVYILVERFKNGAHVYLRLRFHSNHPYEVEIAPLAWEDSVPLRHCIITATMGNYARLRTLYLKDRTQSSRDLWPHHSGTAFTPHARFPLRDLIRTAEGEALFIAAPDEAHPDEADYAPGTFSGWKYSGVVATQYWRCEHPRPGLEGWVNGRSVYWASECSIPGGVAFENLELVEPFCDGAAYRFGITRKSPEELIDVENLLNEPPAPAVPPPMED